MTTLPYKILFLCTGNSARSIMAEYIIRQIDPRRFESFSAGAKPTGKVNPIVLQILKRLFVLRPPGLEASLGRNLKPFALIS
jgi:protein-tyrosine-phosphatase